MISVRTVDLTFEKNMCKAALSLYDVWVVDNLVTVSQGALGNHERHFLNMAKEWLCHDWRNRCHRRTFIFLSLSSPAQYGFTVSFSNYAHFQVHIISFFRAAFILFLHFNS